MPPGRSMSGVSNATINSHDERTPLLEPISPVPTDITVEPPTYIEGALGRSTGILIEDEDTPLPRFQIFLLCLTRLVEPIAFFSIFPYITYMIERIGVEKEDVGFYTGLIESLFSATQMCVMILWGKASDRFGRKPCLVLSIFGAAVGTALFGTSTTIWQLILYRCIAGAFSGTMVTVRTMISENSTKKTQARAFSYFAFAGNLGIFVGPLLGGVLERPADKFPSIFGRIQFLHDYPYALPGFVTASIGLIAGILSAIFLRETLHLNKHRKSNEAPMSTWELIKYPGVTRVLVIYNYIALMAFAYTAVAPIFLFTPVKLGGIGFRPELIAAAIATNGVSQALWILVIFAPLQRLIGTGGVLRLCASAWPFFFAAHPLCHFFLRYHLNPLFWTVGPMNLIIGSGVAMAFTANQLALNDIAPTHETLGTLNAIALSISSGLRAIAPALAASIYATGVKYHIAEGQLFWIVAIALACGLIALLRYLPEKVDDKPGNSANGEA